MIWFIQLDTWLMGWNLKYTFSSPHTLEYHLNQIVMQTMFVCFSQICVLKYTCISIWFGKVCFVENGIYVKQHKHYFHLHLTLSEPWRFTFMLSTTYLCGVQNHDTHFQELIEYSYHIGKQWMNPGIILHFQSSAY